MSLAQPSDYLYLVLNLASIVPLGWVLWSVLKRYRQAHLMFTAIVGIWALLFVIHEVSSVVSIVTEPDFHPNNSLLARNVLDIAGSGILLYLVSR